MELTEPKLLRGAIAFDDRGSVSFVNDFGFNGVKRSYLIQNHRQGFVRAWHGHKIESKYMMCVSGSVLVGAVKVDSWDSPSKTAQVHRFVLSAGSPAVLAIPAGYANGLMNLSEDAKLMVFSTTTMEQAKDDDFRFPSRHWDIWSVEER
jgi:dTDP-4-dehydrorhamnose 3,5-epimerase